MLFTIIFNYLSLVEYISRLLNASMINTEKQEVEKI